MAQKPRRSWEIYWIYPRTGNIKLYLKGGNEFDEFIDQGHFRQ